MKQLLKNTYIAEQDRGKIEKFINDLLEFYDVVIIGELEFEQIRNARQLYEANHKKTQFYCFDCKKVKKAKYPNFFKVCNNCPHQVKKQAIKDVPANFE